VREIRGILEATTDAAMPDDIRGPVPTPACWSEGEGDGGSGWNWSRLSFAWYFGTEVTMTYRVGDRWSGCLLEVRPDPKLSGSLLAWVYEFLDFDNEICTYITGRHEVYDVIM